MIKHTLVLSSLVVVLVGSLMYCISPDEIRIVYAAARSRLSTDVDELLGATRDRGTKLLKEVRAQPGPSRGARQ